MPDSDDASAPPIASNASQDSSPSSDSVEQVPAQLQPAMDPAAVPGDVYLVTQETVRAAEAIFGRPIPPLNGLKKKPFVELLRAVGHDAYKHVKLGVGGVHKRTLPQMYFEVVHALAEYAPPTSEHASPSSGSSGDADASVPSSGAAAATACTEPPSESEEEPAAADGGAGE